MSPSGRRDTILDIAALDEEIARLKGRARARGDRAPRSQLKFRLIRRRSRRTDEEFREYVRVSGRSRGGSTRHGLEARRPTETSRRPRRAIEVIMGCSVIRALIAFIVVPRPLGLPSLFRRVMRSASSDQAPPVDGKVGVGWDR
jgi:hypothetical protein